MTTANAPIRVTVVTMDSHMSTALTAAADRVAFEVPGLSLSVHTADHWDDRACLDACIADIGRADIVVASMLFLDDHIRAVLPALEARREACDAMVCCMSAGEVVRLTKLGKFSMAAGQGGPMAMLKKLRGSSKPGSSGRGQMKMLKRLPRMLRFIPGTAQDMRSYFLAMQYWLSGSEENYANMLRMLVGKYARAASGAKLQIAAPVEYPEIGLYHPEARTRMVVDAAHLPRRSGEVGKVGLLVLRSYVLAGNAGHYDGVISAMEKRGLRVLPAFASGLDARETVQRFFMKDGVAIVDAVVSLTGFSLVGGPAYNDAQAAEVLLASLDVPYVGAHPVEFQTLAQWETDARGLTPVESTMMVALPELDGATGPITFGGRGGPQGHDMFVHAERAAMLAARVSKLVVLRRRARAEKKLAIVLFNFPPNAGATGTARIWPCSSRCSTRCVLWRPAGIAWSCRPASMRCDFPSLKATRHASVRTPTWPRAFRPTIMSGASRICARSRSNGARHRVARRPMAAGFSCLAGSSAMCSSASSQGLATRATQCGCSLRRGSRRRMRSRPSTVGYARISAPTRCCISARMAHWNSCRASRRGLSAACWPDRLIGDLPNFYFYASNNPSEGLLAKRRGGATLISHLTPSITQAGLYRGLAELKSSIDRFRALEPGAGETADLAAMIQAQAATLDMAAAGPAWDETAGVAILALSSTLLDVEYTLIPHGLHVIGTPPSAEERAELLDAADITDPARRATLDALLAADNELPRCCMRWMAAISTRHRAAICCATRMCCRQGAICTASTRSACRANSPCRTVRRRPTVCSRAIGRMPARCRRRSPWCCGAATI